MTTTAPLAHPTPSPLHPSPMSTSGFSPSVDPGALAVIFTSQRTPGDDGYAQTAEEMVRLAAEQDGFLGVESAREANGLGLTVSYWREYGFER
jgi:hypothetical protein